MLQSREAFFHSDTLSKSPHVGGTPRTGWSYLQLIFSTSWKKTLNHGYVLRHTIYITKAGIEPQKLLQYITRNIQCKYSKTLLCSSNLYKKKERNIPTKLSINKRTKHNNMYLLAFLNIKYSQSQRLGRYISEKYSSPLCRYGECYGRLQNNIKYVDCVPQEKSSKTVPQDIFIQFLWSPLEVSIYGTS